jgi:hypothetical protein
MEDAIIQLGNIKQKHTQIFEKLKQIQSKIQLMLSKQGGKNKEIQELIRSIEKIIKTSGLSDETFEPINKSFEDAKKKEDDEDRISSLEEVKNRYIKLIDNINKEKIVKIKSEIDSIINSIQKSVDKYTAKDKAEIEKEFEGFTKKYASDLKLNDLIKLKNDLEEMNISRFGKIKVYMKIKPTKSGDNIISKDGSYIINDFFQINNDQTIEILPDNKFGPFSKVSFTTEKIGKDSEYKNITKNKNLFDEMCSENSPLNINSLLGRSTILFGYGISGSGKSWTILGGKDDEGLIPLLIKSLTTNGITVKPFKIFEHHLNSDDFIKTDPSRPHFDEGKLKSKIRNFDLKTYAKEDNSPIDFIKLEKARIKLRSIKETPNNPTSSRTHLFIVYEIEKDGKTGYVTFIDSAGKEEPLEIAKQFYTKSASGEDIKNAALPFAVKPITAKDPKLSLFSSASYSRIDFSNNDFESLSEKSKVNLYIEKLEFIKDVIREGFFINESLAHMIYYFTGEENISGITILNRTLKDDLKRELEKDESMGDQKADSVKNYESYNKKGKLNVFYTPPSKIDGKIETLAESNDKDPIMITTIFDYLTNLCTVKDQKKFKFVMLGNTRTEAKYRDDIIKTLRLVDLLKST